MELRQKRQLLKKLAEAVNKVTEGHYGLPSIFGPGDGWSSVGPTFAWDGPFEWTMITAGSSVHAGEMGNYATPTEAGIQTVLDEISEAGYYLEVENNSHIVICDA